MKPIGEEILYFDELDSTNEEAKRRLQKKSSQGLVIVADKQTSGKGRLGRTWDSNHEDGLWCSFTFVPPSNEIIIQKITLLFAVSVFEALTHLAGDIFQIKWPNDIIADGKKISGILCESRMDGKQARYMIAGVGINVNQIHFPNPLKSIATSLCILKGQRYDKKTLLFYLIDRINYHLDAFFMKQEDSFLDIFIKNCSTIGRSIRIQNEEYLYWADHIMPNGNLCIIAKDGQIKELSSGEVFEVE